MIQSSWDWLKIDSWGCVFDSRIMHVVRLFKPIILPDVRAHIIMGLYV